MIFLVILSFHESKTTSDHQNPVVDILNLHRKIRRLKEIKKSKKYTQLPNLYHQFSYFNK